MAAIFFPDCKNLKFKNKERGGSDGLLGKGGRSEVELGRAAALDFKCQSLIGREKLCFWNSATLTALPKVFTSLKCQVFGKRKRFV